MNRRDSGDERHRAAREQTIGWLVEAVREGDYLDALQWLNTLAAVDERFIVTAEDILASWRARAGRARSGARPTDADDDPVQSADYRGLFGALLEHCHDGIVISAVADGWMLECSKSFAALTGYAREELLGRTSVELALIDPELRSAAVQSTRQTGSGGGLRTRLRRKSGEIRWVEFSPQMLMGDELLLTIVRDVTERTVYEESLRRLADHDTLTEVFTRRRFKEEVERRISEASRYGEPAVLLLLDIDAFKSINDTHGHLVGDRALKTVADVLRACVRSSDAIGRLGGDEFGVLLARADGAAAARVVHDIQERLLERAIDADGTTVTISATVGTARLDDDTADYEALVRVADRAMYRAKARR